jgi:predicted transcriptional regulator of viral defense system
MKSIDAQKKLLDLNQPIITTIDAAACLNFNITAASKVLSRLADAKIITKIKKGLWAMSNTIDPLKIAEYLTSPLPCYISLQTALFYHGMIDQIPITVYVVSLARTKKYNTLFGDFSIHHINSDFFFGFNVIENTYIKLASPEKALLDFLYLTPAKSNLFKALPEIEIPKNFNKKQAFIILDKIRPISRQNMVKNKLIHILSS